MKEEDIPVWIMRLEEDLEFIRKFILASGSLKEMAKEYGVSYPTIRLRLDKLIQLIQMSNDNKKDSYISLVKKWRWMKR